MNPWSAQVKGYLRIAPRFGSLLQQGGLSSFFPGGIYSRYLLLLSCLSRSRVRLSLALTGNPCPPLSYLLSTLRLLPSRSITFFKIGDASLQRRPLRMVICQAGEAFLLRAF